MRPITPVRSHLLAMVTYAALATWFCWPVAADPTHLALGHPGNDVWNHVWGYRWVASALLAGDVPVHTDLLGWPSGGALWFIDAFNVVLTLPVQLVAGPVAAYNASIWFNLWLCGVGAYVLALRVTGSTAGAWLAGVAYASTPQLLGQAYNGITETLAAGWLPLALAALREAVRDPRPRRGALAGVVVGITTIANWYYGLFAGMFFAGMLGRAASTWWGRSRWPRAALLRAAGTLVAGGLALALTAAVPFGLFAASMSADDALVSRDERFVWMTLLLHNMTDGVALFHPGRFYSPDLKAVFREDLIVVVYVGYALILPALAALVLARPRGVTRPWAVAAVAYLLFALGPFLYWGGDYVQIAGGWVPLPFLAFFKFFPMFSRISHAYRFVVGLTLALCVLAAWAVRAAGQRGWDPRTLAAVLGALRVVETFYASSAVLPLPVTEVRVPAALATLDGGAVLDLPVGVPVLARSSYLAGQLVHHQPVPYGLNDPTPPILYYNRYTQYLLELERSTVTMLPPTLPLLDLELGRAVLVDAGLRWIVLHTDAYPASQYPKVVAFLDLTATLHADADGVRIYRLDPDIAPIEGGAGEGVPSSAATDAAAAPPTSALPAADR